MNYELRKKELIEYWKRLGIAKNVLDAFEAVPREYFVPEEYKNRAYDDIPLPLDSNATISQPTTIMMMLNWLEPKKTDKILEIGTGSGYNAALLSKLCKKVISTEINKNLAKNAEQKMQELKIKNVKIIPASGKYGYPKEAPYDKIIATAAFENVPHELISQLKEGGTLLIPVGKNSQKMLKIIKEKDRIREQSLGDFLFVPVQEE